MRGSVGEVIRVNMTDRKTSIEEQRRDMKTWGEVVDQ